MSTVDDSHRNIQQTDYEYGRHGSLLSVCSLFALSDIDTAM
jgi:hypothetical protein